MTPREHTPPKRPLPTSCGKPLKAHIDAKPESAEPTKLRDRLVRLIARILKEVA